MKLLMVSIICVRSKPVIAARDAPGTRDIFLLRDRPPRRGGPGAGTPSTDRMGNVETLTVRRIFAQRGHTAHVLSANTVFFSSAEVRFAHLRCRCTIPH